MDKLNKDELFTLSLHLDLPELFALCHGYRKFNEKICKDASMWRRKIEKDFPEFKFEELREELKDFSFKELYVLLYTKNIWKIRDSINEMYDYIIVDLFEDGVLLPIIPDYLRLPNLEELNLYNKTYVIPENVDFPNLQSIYLYLYPGDTYNLKVPERFKNMIKLQTRRF